MASNVSKFTEADVFKLLTTVQPVEFVKTCDDNISIFVSVSKGKMTVEFTDKTTGEKKKFIIHVSEDSA